MGGEDSDSVPGDPPFRRLHEFQSRSGSSPKGARGPSSWRSSTSKAEANFAASAAGG
jgi:hypothetical protein